MENKKFNKSKFHYRTKRFFTKKSVAFILSTIIILVGFFSFNISVVQAASCGCASWSTTCNTSPGGSSFANCAVLSTVPAGCTVVPLTSLTRQCSISQASKAPIPPTWSVKYKEDLTGTISTGDFTYKGDGLWYNNAFMPGTENNKQYQHGNIATDIPNYTQAEVTSMGMPANIAALAVQYDTALQEYNASIGREKVNQTTVWDIIWGGLAGTVGSIAQFAADQAGGVIAFVLEFITIPIASFLLAVAGSILDFSVQFTIFGTGFTKDLNGSIQTVWVLLRDTANITFIFILLYAAIKQIVTGVAAQKILMSIIISAVLINFSFFITRVVIDASNLVATSIYNQIQTVTDESTSKTQGLLKAVGGSSGAITNIDLSGMIMDGLNLTTIYDSTKNNNTATSAASIVGVSGLLNAFTRLVLFLITTFVFFALSALLIGRFVMLVVLMATSPIGFVGEVIPGIGTFSTAWRKSLQDQVLIAPAIMFFMLLTIRLSQILAKQASTGPMMVFFNFFLVVYLLLKSVSLTKSLSGPMGNFVDKIAQVGTGLALGAATGGTALVARQVAGRGANALANSKYGQRLSNAAASGSFIGGNIAKATLGTLKSASTGTFDMRNTTALKEVLGQAGTISGIGGGIIDKSYLKASGEYGKGQTGFSGLMDKQKKDAVKQAEAFEGAAGDYEKRVVDREIVERFKQEEIKLEKQIEDATRNGEVTEAKTLSKKLDAIKSQRQTLQNNPKEAMKKLQAAGTGENFKESDKNMQKLDNEKKKLEADKLANIALQQKLEADKQKALTTFEKDKIEKELVIARKESAKLDDDIKTKTEEQTKAAEINNDIKELDNKLSKIKDDLSKKNFALEGLDKMADFVGGGISGAVNKATFGYVRPNLRGGLSSSTIETIQESKNTKANYAKYIRNKFLSANFTPENAEIARAAEMGTSQSDKDKAKEEKAADELAKKVAKQMKEDSK